MSGSTTNRLPIIWMLFFKPIRSCQRKFCQSRYECQVSRMGSEWSVPPITVMLQFQYTQNLHHNTNKLSTDGMKNLCSQGFTALRNSVQSINRTWFTGPLKGLSGDKNLLAISGGVQNTSPDRRLRHATSMSANSNSSTGNALFTRRIFQSRILTRG